ncbi:hypothetical protein CXG50_04480 [Pseudomonas plecoglossicida]|nr:hypothetical protein CX682_20910 [Pseudomonas sp. FFUP_PS_41]PLU99228.1 hypothetical protein CXG52_09395 [Pseudomonas plecoglossicida]PLV11044.1 hypothetical protein CXG50_04480 [Pseudomonas plecoglossicida]
MPVPASSRVNPLPQVLHKLQTLCGPCGSGFTRERANPAYHRIRTPRLPINPFRSLSSTSLL